MADYPLGSLGLQIKDHWKKYRPQMYAELEKAGDLAESLHAARERTKNLMDSLLAKGLPHHQAWEAGEGGVGVPSKRWGVNKA